MHKLYCTPYGGPWHRDGKNAWQRSQKHAHTHPLAIMVVSREVLGGGPDKYAVLCCQPHRQVPKNILQLVGFGARKDDKHVVGVLAYIRNVSKRVYMCRSLKQGTIDARLPFLYTLILLQATFH
jgi:hypothetical protein